MDLIMRHSAIMKIVDLECKVNPSKPICAKKFLAKLLTENEYLPKRLPEETGEYLVYTDCDEIFVEPYDEWQADFGHWYEEFSEETGGKIGEQWRSADDNCMKVVAWMPLPSPYKGDEE